MSIQHDLPQLGRFPIRFHPQGAPVRERAVTVPEALPTPLLDPETLRAARLAYESATSTLRARSGAPLRPGTLHSLANKILSFAIFGERDQTRLSARALAHFP
jgi:hypothetical protein